MASNSQLIAQGPLAGITIVELGDGTAGPYAAKLFGDFGAEVIKVEEPGGDSSRRRGPFPNGQFDPEASGLFMYLNINKYGVMLDLESKTSAASMDLLLKRADVFITNLPSKRLRALKLDAASLRERYPSLIVTTISPFGIEGPWADKLGNELITYAMSGIAYSTPGMPEAADDLDREPPLHPACFVGETIAGVVSATATMTALMGRGRTQQGCHVEVSQHAAMAAMQIRDVTNAAYVGTHYNRLLNPTTIGRMPNFYLPCKDGYVTVAAPMEIHWERLTQAMGNPAWAQSEDYATEVARTANWVTLRLKLIEWTMTLTGDELLVFADKSQLPIFPFYSIRKMADSEHSRERRTLVEVQIGAREARIPAAPFKMRATPWSLRRPAPRLGEHTAKILDDGLAA
jgi:crotonobetainyl-CoA:carnitine CoA-transferase CaiB-like acyl-CoA transferase